MICVGERVEVIVEDVRVLCKQLEEGGERLEVTLAQVPVCMEVSVGVMITNALIFKQ